jgi:DNA segregation ATPase FtsK/SpoIIIE-like protein
MEGLPLDEYREIEPLYDELLKVLPSWEIMTVKKLQREYRLGYNRAARLLERLSQEGHLHWHQRTGDFAPVRTAARTIPEHM